MQPIKNYKIRSLIQEEFQVLHLSAHEKQLVNMDGIVETIVAIQERYIKFAEKHKKENPGLYNKDKLEDMVKFQINKLVKAELKKHLVSVYH